ncbi:MAG TPA: LacI family DNA-binding transcriptional regulator [Pseudonocardiaceae bacterium]|jgi:DNA-binding LacI/PurR family transcriptional regulator|nr:LacI family DNA-binding transcriptional regulator [Pseudonocardiaceae bacterium]
MATIDDVARAAGVSRSTVSYVLSGKRTISTETRRRVEQSIRALGYRPHAGARALASSRTNVLALVIPLRTEVNVAVVMQFVASIAQHARRHDHDVLLLTKDEGAEGLRRAAGTAMCDGIIVMEIEASEPRVPVLNSLSLPSVLIGVPDDTRGLPCVDLDFEATGQTCVNHLADLGHTEIALVAPAPEVYQRGTSFARRFLRGYTTTARDRGVHATVYPCGSRYDAAAACLDQILAEQPGVTGLVVHNEAAMHALLTSLRERGIRIPQDISIIAICPDDVAENQAVELTSVAIPVDEVSRVAVDMAMERVVGPTRAEIRLISPHVTQRFSTAPPR